MKHTLKISGLTASIGDKRILNGVNLTIGSGEVHAIMGPNGSGKSTLANALMGHPSCTVDTSVSRFFIDKTPLIDLDTEQRAKAGLFLAFQSPIAVPGVSVMNLLRESYQQIYGTSKRSAKRIQNPVLGRAWDAGGVSIADFMNLIKSTAKLLHLDESFLSRGIHDGFSGGEKKKIEMLQALVLAPKFAIFDEIDTGLDVDALTLVAKGVKELSRRGTGVLIITHYQRILQYVKPDVVHVFIAGTVVKSGTSRLAGEIEKTGYRKYQE